MKIEQRPGHVGKGGRSRPGAGVYYYCHHAMLAEEILSVQPEAPVGTIKRLSLDLRTNQTKAVVEDDDV